MRIRRSWRSCVAAFPVVLATLAMGSATAAPCLSSLEQELQCTRRAAVPYCCPDDYCRKPQPSSSCLCIPGCCDDYCRKPQPCSSCLCIPGCCDDYCPKPLPTFCWPVDGRFHRCWPTGIGRSCSDVPCGRSPE